MLGLVGRISPAGHDLLVVGGGAVGLLTAWRAHEQCPDARIALVDQGPIAGGATAASGGHCQPYGRTPQMRDWADESRLYYAELRLKMPDVPMWEMPLLVVAGRTSATEVQACYLDAPKSIGSQDLLGKLGLSVPPQDTVLGIVSSVMCHPPRLMARLYDRLLHARTFEPFLHCRVRALKPGPAAHDVILQDGRVLSAERLVVATGAGLIEEPLLPLPNFVDVGVKKIASFLIQRRPAFAGGGYFVDRQIGLFGRPDLGGWLLSIRSEEWTPRRDVITARDVAIAKEALDLMAPGEDGTILGGWVGREGYPPGGEPLIETPTGSPGLVAVGACAGFGVRVAPAIARLTLKRIAWPTK